jgi:hypothetical protein
VLLTRFSSTALLLILIAIGLLTNVGEGIRLGQNATLFYPMGRSRETLAVALSMMRSPPALGYQGYNAIGDLLKDHGLYIGEDDTDQARREAFFRNSDAINDTLTAALTISVDPAHQDEAIYANDLGYADFMHLSFVIFGVKLGSLYYFYCILLTIGVIAFALEFYNARFLLYSLSVYLSIHLFLLSYSSGLGPPVGSIANSRTFTGLALLPALHLGCQLFADTPLRIRSCVTAVVQALLLTFVLTCRFDVAWEVGFVFVAAATVALFHVAYRALHGTLPSIRRVTSLWPALVLLLAVSGFSVQERLAVGPAYRNDTMHHLLWDAVLTVMLTYDAGLYERYTGTTTHPEDADETGCLAVNYHLRVQPEGPAGGNRSYDCDSAPNIANVKAGDYDATARLVVLKIVREQPFALMGLVPLILDTQITKFQETRWFSLEHFQLSGFFVVLSVLVYVMTGGLIASGGEITRAIVFGGLLLTCALIDPLVSVSPMVLGSLASLMLVLTLVVSSAILMPTTLLAKRMIGRPRIVSPRA